MSFLGFNFTNMRILITGATGFIGGAMALQLASAWPQAQITATGRRSTTRFDGCLNIVYRPMDLLALDAPLHFDLCIHCAGLADDASTPEALEMHNVVATHLLLRQLVDCQCFVFISSSSVYDFSDGKPKSETDAQSANTRLSAYGRSKYQAEKEVEAATAIPSRYILRPRAVYGADDTQLMPRILRLVKGGRMFIPGHLRYQASLTHIDNLVQAVRLAVEQSKAGVHCYNVADRQPYLLRNVFESVARMHTSTTVRMVTLPLPILSAVVRFCEVFGIRSRLTRQALDYLSQHAVLDTSAGRAALGDWCVTDFEGFVRSESLKKQ